MRIALRTFALCTKSAILHSTFGLNNTFKTGGFGFAKGRETLSFVSFNERSMIKYEREIFVSIIISGILFAIVTIFTGSIIAGISIFTAVLVTINFILSRYETRNEATVELKITVKDKIPYLSLLIVNTGGKTIYLDKSGIVTNDGVVIDFDEEPKPELITKPEPKKPKTAFPFLSTSLESQNYNLKTPKFKAPTFSLVNPGDAKSERKEVTEVIELFIEKKVALTEDFELKGFFTDQLNHRYESEWIRFDKQTVLQGMKNYEK